MLSAFFCMGEYEALQKFLREGFLGIENSYWGATKVSMGPFSGVYNTLT